MHWPAALEQLERSSKRKAFSPPYTGRFDIFQRSPKGEAEEVFNKT